MHGSIIPSCTCIWPELRFITGNNLVINWSGKIYQIILQTKFTWAIIIGDHDDTHVCIIICQEPKQVETWVKSYKTCLLLSYAQTMFSEQMRDMVVIGTTQCNSTCCALTL